MTLYIGPTYPCTEVESNFTWLGLNNMAKENPLHSQPTLSHLSGHVIEVPFVLLSYPGRFRDGSV